MINRVIFFYPCPIEHSTRQIVSNFLKCWKIYRSGTKRLAGRELLKYKNLKIELNPSALGRRLPVVLYMKYYFMESTSAATPLCACEWGVYVHKWNYLKVKHFQVDGNISNSVFTHVNFRFECSFIIKIHVVRMEMFI